MFPLVAVPVIGQTGQRLFFVVPDMEPAPCAVGRYGRYRVAIAQRFRCRHLPRCECRLILHRLVLSNNAGAFLLPHHPRAEPRSLRCLAMDINQDILQVRLLGGVFDPLARCQPHRGSTSTPVPLPPVVAAVCLQRRRPSLHGARRAGEYDAPGGSTTFPPRRR